MKHEVIVKEAHQISGRLIGRSFIITVDGVTITGTYGLRWNPGKKTSYDKWNDPGNRNYCLRLKGNINKHPDYKTIRIQILEALNKEYKLMSSEFWRGKV